MKRKNAVAKPGAEEEKKEEQRGQSVNPFKRTYTKKDFGKGGSKKPGKEEEDAKDKPVVAEKKPTPVKPSKAGRLRMGPDLVGLLDSLAEPF